MSSSITPNQTAQFLYYAAGQQMQDGFVRIGERIARGGMGVIHEAELIPDPHSHRRISYMDTDTRVVVKIFNPEDPAADNTSFTQRFDVEGKTLSELRHENIIRYLGTGETMEPRPFHVLARHYGGSTDYVIMSRCKAEGYLREVVIGNQTHFFQYGLRDDDVPPRQKLLMHLKFVRGFGLPVFSGLAYAHGHGVTHRDMKPANILLSIINSNGIPMPTNVKIADFGIAKKIVSRDILDYTKLGSTVGTFLCMAPEQLQGSLGASHQVDVFAVGVILFEMLTGRRLVANDPRLDQRQYMLQYVDLMRDWRCIDPGDYVDGIPPTFREFIRTSTEKDPLNRYPNGAVAFDALRAITLPEESSIETAQTLLPISVGYDFSAKRSDDTPISLEMDDLTTPVTAKRIGIVPAAPPQSASVHAPGQARLPVEVTPQSSWRMPLIVAVGIAAIAFGAGTVLLFHDNGTSSPPRTQALQTEQRQAVATPPAPLLPTVSAGNTIPLSLNTRYDLANGEMKHAQMDPRLLPKARDSYLAALRLTPNAPEIYRKLAEVSLRLGNRQQAKAYSAQAAQLEQAQKR